MIDYVTSSPIWIDPKPAIRRLEGKSVLITHGENRSPATLRVLDAAAISVSAGKCSVQAFRTPASDKEWQPLQSRIVEFPGGKSLWECYLTEKAIKALRAATGTTQEELVLEIRDRRRSKHQST